MARILNKFGELQNWKLIGTEHLCRDKPLHKEISKLMQEEVPDAFVGEFGPEEFHSITSGKWTTRTQLFTMTFLRDPVARDISLFYWWSWQKERGKLSLRRYISMLRSKPEYNSKALKLLAYSFDSPLYRKLPSSLVDWNRVSKEEKEVALSAAFANLRDRFDFFGLQEYYDESLIMLSYKLCIPWHLLEVYESSKVTSNRNDSLVRTEIGAFLEQRNELNIQLYQKAKQEFLRRVDETRRKYPHFDDDMARLKASRPPAVRCDESLQTSRGDPSCITIDWDYALERKTRRRRT